MIPKKTYTLNLTNPSTISITLPPDATEGSFTISATLTASGEYSYGPPASSGGGPTDNKESGEVDAFVEIISGGVVKDSKKIGSVYCEHPDIRGETTNTTSNSITLHCSGLSSSIEFKVRTYVASVGAGTIGANIVLSSYSFNTTADVALASGNAFFLCTDQHNSPYTISDN